MCPKKYIRFNAIANKQIDSNGLYFLCVVFFYYFSTPSKMSTQDVKNLFFGYCCSFCIQNEKFYKTISNSKNYHHKANK